MRDEYHLIGRLIGEAVVASWRGALDREDGVAGFDFREVEETFLAALRAKGMEVVSVEARPINLVGAWEKAGFYVPPAPKRTI